LIIYAFNHLLIEINTLRFAGFFVIIRQLADQDDGEKGGVLELLSD